MPPRRVSSRVGESDRNDESEAEHKKETASSEKTPERINPGTKIYLGIAIIFIVATINTGYEAYGTMVSLDQDLDVKAKNCLFEFSKKQCSAVNPSEECKQQYECIRENGD